MLSGNEQASRSLSREEGGGRAAYGSEEATHVLHHQVVDMQTQADHALLVAVGALLKPEVLDLTLQGCVLEVPVLLF